MESTRFNWTWDEKDILDLTEENVQKVFQSCLATLNTKTEDIVESSFMDDSSAIKIPIMKFDKNRLSQNREKIRYLLGQIEDVQLGYELSAFEGFNAYSGNKWTNNKIALFALYYLGAAEFNFPKFGADNTCRVPNEIRRCKSFYSKHRNYMDFQELNNLLDNMGSESGFCIYFNSLPLEKQNEVSKTLYYYTFGYEEGQRILELERSIQALKIDEDNELLKKSIKVQHSNSLLHQIAMHKGINDIMYWTRTDRLYYVANGCTIGFWASADCYKI